mmetsp:Transcript_79656/g.225903  ORF Transcript_79656/g.225903 Transcript_79656/m.225903 type:complete len:85 (-) Transcript_79656:17-271(-)
MTVPWMHRHPGEALHGGGTVDPKLPSASDCGGGIMGGGAMAPAIAAWKSGGAMSVPQLGHMGAPPGMLGGGQHGGAPRAGSMAP